MVWPSKGVVPQVANGISSAFPHRISRAPVNLPRWKPVRRLCRAILIHYSAKRVPELKPLFPFSTYKACRYAGPESLVAVAAFCSPPPFCFIFMQFRVSITWYCNWIHIRSIAGPYLPLVDLLRPGSEVLCF